MITAIILTFFIGTLTGYVVAALMAVSSNADRAREEQEKEQPPVVKIEEKKLMPLVAVQEIPLGCMNSNPSEIEEKAIANSLMGQFNDDIKQRVVWDIDPRRKKHIVKLRIWVDTEI